MLNEKIAKSANIPESMMRAADLYGESPALYYKKFPGDKYSGKYSFKQMADIQRVVGTVLVEEFDLKPKQKVGFISENRPEYNLGDLGTLCAAGISWGLYDYDVKTQEVVEYKLNDSETSILITSPDFLDNVRTVFRGGNTPLKKVIVMDMPHNKIDYLPHETPFSDILKNGIEDADLIENRLSTVNRDSVARIIYTSGTTGRPKGVMLTHGNLLSNVEMSSKLLDITPGERLICFLPEAHSFQGFVTLATLLNGGQMWYSHKKTILDDMKLIEPTLFAGVPLVYKRIAEGMRSKVLELTKGQIDLAADYSKNPIKQLIRSKVLGPIIRKKVGLGKILRAVSGSAKLEQEHFNMLNNIGFTVLEGYGISETSPVISCNELDNFKPGSVGRPIPGCDVKIMSLDTDEYGKREEVPQGEEGEVLVKGPNVFKGYYNDEVKTKKAFYEGYYETGDRGHMDSDGFLYIHGRCGLQVKMANGEFVDLDQLAANILKHTSIIQSVAIDCELKQFVIAIVSIDWEPESIRELADKMGIPFSGDVNEFAKNPAVIDAIKKEIEEKEPDFGHPKSPKVPKKYLIVTPMSPITGEITSTLKFRVRNILKKYEKQLEKLRNSDDKFMVAMD